MLHSAPRFGLVAAVTLFCATLGSPTAESQVPPNAAASTPVQSAQQQAAAVTVPSFSLNVSGDQVQLSPSSRIFLNLRTPEGKLSKAIEAKPDGSTVINSFTKDKQRLYELYDYFNGSAHMLVFQKDQQKVEIKISEDGTVDVRILPSATPAPANVPTQP